MPGVSGMGRKMRYLPVRACGGDCWWKESAEQCQGGGRHQSHGTAHTSGGAQACAGGSGWPGAVYSVGHQSKVRASSSEELGGPRAGWGGGPAGPRGLGSAGSPQEGTGQHRAGQHGTGSGHTGGHQQPKKLQMQRGGAPV